MGAREKRALAWAPSAVPACPHAPACPALPCGLSPSARTEHSPRCEPSSMPPTRTQSPLRTAWRASLNASADSGPPASTLLTSSSRRTPSLPMASQNMSRRDIGRRWYTCARNASRGAPDPPTAASSRTSTPYDSPTSPPPCPPASPPPPPRSCPWATPPSASTRAPPVGRSPPPAAAAAAAAIAAAAAARVAAATTPRVEASRSPGPPPGDARRGLWHLRPHPPTPRCESGPAAVGGRRRPAPIRVQNIP